MDTQAPFSTLHLLRAPRPNWMDTQAPFSTPHLLRAPRPNWMDTQAPFSTPPLLRAPHPNAAGVARVLLLHVPRVQLDDLCLAGVVQSARVSLPWPPVERSERTLGWSQHVAVA